MQRFHFENDCLEELNLILKPFLLFLVSSFSAVWIFILWLPNFTSILGQFLDFFFVTTFYFVACLIYFFYILPDLSLLFSFFILYFVNYLFPFWVNFLIYFFFNTFFFVVRFVYSFYLLFLSFFSIFFIYPLLRQSSLYPFLQSSF